jgi:cobyrinic acid a,c-diamide synthase
MSRMSQFYISAANKSSGKTSVSIGLCAALAARGHVVQTFKKGPDYIDPMWLGEASGRDCYNLDFYLMAHDSITGLYNEAAAGADITLVEGNKGLYDGVDIHGADSNAALAKLLKLPVVLVIDTRGMTRGIAPLLRGYQDFDADLNIAGVILNQVGGQRHEGKLRKAVEHYTDIPVLGAVYHDDALELSERHIGLIPCNEHPAAQGVIARLADDISRQVDIDRLLALTEREAPGATTGMKRTYPDPDLRIGIARDESFGFYYPDDLQAFRSAGAELIPVDMSNDRMLPDIDGLFIGGGFPESHMETLEQNVSMRTAVHDAIENGLPVYAECGGLMYLARRIVWNDRHCEMAGIIPADVIMHEKPVGRGYARFSETSDSPWPATSGSTADIPAHEFHYSTLSGLDPSFKFKYAYDISRGHGIDGSHDGIVYKNLLACYIHQRNVTGNEWVSRFIEFVRNRQAVLLQGLQ